MPKIRPAVVRELAECRYERETREHEAKVAAEQAVLTDRLADDAYAVSLGLPADLPEATREILGRTMALDRLGPAAPRRDLIYRQYGIE